MKRAGKSSALSLLERNSVVGRSRSLRVDSRVENALRSGGIADMTTIGRRSGHPHRIEIFFHYFDGENFIAGRPGFRRDWLANLTSNPEFTLHLKRGVQVDMPAKATVITDPIRRREVLFKARTESWGADPEKVEKDMDRWVALAPLVSFTTQNN